MDWGSTGLLIAEQSGIDVKQPLIPSETKWTCAKYVQHRSDASFLEQRDKTLGNAIEKWRFLITVYPEQSVVGRQLMTVDTAEVDIVLLSVMGVKSPNTILKYFRWHSAHGSSSFLPLDESDIWRYVLRQKDNAGPPTRSQSLVQALRFARYVMGFNGALGCVNSGRIIGQAQLQWASKAPTRCARPLTVNEVKMLRKSADGAEHSKVDRRIASNLLFCLYGRCRVSDVSSVHEILH